jgi:transposase-like protein
MGPSEFSEALQALSQMSVQQLQLVASEAARLARDAEARSEIERHIGNQPGCPHCGQTHVIRWGTHNGLQRWRCRGCDKTFNSAYGSGLARTKRRETFHAFARNMLETSPLSCREAAREFGINRMTAWRWRMKICDALAGTGSEQFSGIVEADETFQRESRKASREWVKHEQIVWEVAEFIEQNNLATSRAELLNLLDNVGEDFDIQLKQIADNCGFESRYLTPPPRLRWYEHREKDRPMLRGLSRWQVPILTLTDRGGCRRADVLPGLKYKHLGPVLHEHVAPDSVLCSDKAQAYKKFSAVAGVRHVRVAARRGQRIKDQTFHIQTINALHGRFKDFIRDFDGPATGNLKRYVSWFVFRDLNNHNLQGFKELFQRVIAVS